jgi:hypothetical protein
LLEGEDDGEGTKLPKVRRTTKQPEECSKPLIPPGPEIATVPASELELEHMFWDIVIANAPEETLDETVVENTEEAAMEFVTPPTKVKKPRRPAPKFTYIAPDVSSHISY